MITIAIIGASYLQKPLVEKAKQLGYYVICFAWEKGAVCKDLVDKFYPISVLDKEAILEICKKENIDGICSIASDIASPTVAFVAENLGLIGNSYKHSVIANNKYLMRQCFKKNNILSPSYALVGDVNEFLSSIWTYPLIVKPTDRSGSLGVTLCYNSQECLDAIEVAIQCSLEKKGIVESYIEGKEYSVEFISFEGKHYPLAITEKITTGAPNFVELAHHQPAALSEEWYKKIYANTEKALQALGIENGASHSEYKITNDGLLYMIEVGARMGGDFIGSDLVELSTGYDYVKGVIDVCLGQFIEPKLQNNGYSGVYFLCAEQSNLLPYMTADEQWRVKSELFTSELNEVHCSADRNGYLIYKSIKKIDL